MYSFIVETVAKFLGDQGVFITSINKQWRAEWRRQFHYRHFILYSSSQLKWIIPRVNMSFSFFQWQVKYAPFKILLQLKQCCPFDLFQEAVLARRRAFIDHLWSKSIDHTKILAMHGDDICCKKYHREMETAGVKPVKLLAWAICGGNWPMIKKFATEEISAIMTLEILKKCRHTAPFIDMLKFVETRGTMDRHVVNYLYNLVQKGTLDNFVVLLLRVPRPDFYEGIYRYDFLNYLRDSNVPVPMDILNTGDFYPLPSVIWWFLEQNVPMSPKAFTRLLRSKTRVFNAKECDYLQKLGYK